MRYAFLATMLLLAAFFTLIAVVRILRATREMRQRLSSISDIEELDQLLAEGRLSTEEHQRLLHRCMERRRQAGVIGEPRGFDVQQSPNASPTPQDG